MDHLVDVTSANTTVMIIRSRGKGVDHSQSNCMSESSQGIGHIFICAIIYNVYVRSPVKKLDVKYIKLKIELDL